MLQKGSESRLPYKKYCMSILQKGGASNLHKNWFCMSILQKDQTTKVYYVILTERQCVKPTLQKVWCVNRKEEITHGTHFSASCMSNVQLIGYCFTPFQQYALSKTRLEQIMEKESAGRSDFIINDLVIYRSPNMPSSPYCPVTCLCVLRMET